jgi:glutaredoxin
MSGFTNTTIGRPPPRRSLVLLAVMLALVWGIGNGIRWWSDSRDGERLSQLARPGDIRMLSSDTCIYCKAAREWFTRQKVPFEECFIERDAGCNERYQALHAPGTPVLLVKGRPQIGFDPDEVAKALAAGS